MIGFVGFPSEASLIGAVVFFFFLFVVLPVGFLVFVTRRIMLSHKISKRVTLLVCIAETLMSATLLVYIYWNN